MKERQPVEPKNGLGLTSKEFITLPDGQEIPALGEKQAKAMKLFITATNQERLVSRDELVSLLYPQENPILAQQKLRFVLYKLNNKLLPLGWMIDRPRYVDHAGKERKKQDLQFLRKQQGKALKLPQQTKPEKNKPPPNTPPSTKAKVSTDEARPKLPPLPLLPPSLSQPSGHWAEENNERRKENELKAKREEFIINVTAIILSHLAADNMKNPKEHLDKFLSRHLPGNISFSEMIGNNYRDVEEFFACEFRNTVERLWSPMPNSLLSPKERKIVEDCQTLGSQDSDKNASNARRQDVIGIVFGHFSITPHDNERFIA